MATNPDYKMIENSLYHGVVVTGLAIAYSVLFKSLFKVTTPKIDINIKDAGLTAAYICSAIYTKDMLIKKGIIPDNMFK